MECLRLLVLCVAVVAGSAYENKLTKLWSSVTPQRTVVDVESDTYIVNPEGYSDNSAEPVQRSERVVYAFKPRSIPLKEPETAVERTVRYSDIRNADQFKTEILFPGSYFPIADVKKENDSEFDPLARAPFTPKVIPLMRGEYGVQRRSLDGGGEMQDQPVAIRRSFTTYFDDDDEEEDDGKDIEEEEEEEDENGSTRKKGIKKIKKKYMKYMLPLLLAYKLKFFTLIPLLMGGMVLLTGATGMAGFFFALFAAVMGLSKTMGH